MRVQRFFLKKILSHYHNIGTIINIKFYKNIITLIWQCLWDSLPEIRPEMNPDAIVWNTDRISAWSCKSRSSVSVRLFVRHNGRD